MSIISLKNVSKFYRNKKSISTGFSRINLDLDMGEFVVITGESGSGKSTLLNVISGLDSYEEGEMYIDGEETSHYTEIDYEDYRRTYIGNIFQHFNLVNSYTVRQNVELVLLLNGCDEHAIKKKVDEIIDVVGLKKYKNTKASKLSGGQKQRVAIARALAKDTPIIVADEPTGNLDVKSAKSILKLLSEISKKKLVVIVTHNYDQVEEYATRKISMSDGKIIEDKKLKPYEKCDAELVSYDDLTFKNKLKLGFRNAFNIKTKFALLFAVYFFLTLLVFSEYSNIQKQDFSNSLDGYNSLFYVNDPERVVVNKKDKTAFTEGEIEKLRNVENVDFIEKDDLMLDANGSIYDEHYSFYSMVSFKRKSELNHVDEGELGKANNEVVVESYKDSYIKYYLDEFFTKSYNLQLENIDNIFKVEISGVVYNDSDESEVTVYVSDKMFEDIKTMITNKKNKIVFEIDDRNIGMSSNGAVMVRTSSKVKEGEVFIPAIWSNACKNYDCVESLLNVSTSNIYYTEEMKLKIANLINKENYKNLLGADSYEEVSDVVFVNTNDYARLFEKGDYQISLFLDDLLKADETLKFLEDTGYDYYFMKDNLVNMNEQIMGIIKIFRNVIFIIATAALFFISYFIIKIILKSRNVYFSTIRILGATKKVSNSLLNIELLVDINVAFLVFLVLTYLTRIDVISWKFISDMVKFFTFKDYVMVYLVLTLMSLCISNRYAHKLFKDSVMNTYREEV